MSLCIACGVETANRLGRDLPLCASCYVRAAKLIRVKNSMFVKLCNARLRWMRARRARVRAAVLAMLTEEARACAFAYYQACQNTYLS